MSFIKTLFSNQEIINKRKTKWPFVLIIFLVSVMLIASPFVLSRLLESPEQLYEKYGVVDQALIEAFHQEDCSFFDGEISCTNPNTEIVKANAKIFLDVAEGTELETTTNYVLFADRFVTVYVDGESIQGDYSYLEGASFDALLELQQDENIDDKTLVAHFLQNINQSTMASRIPMTYASVLLQYIVYVALVSLIYLAINNNKMKEKFSFKEMVTMNVLAMLSPALISALIGLYRPEHGAAIFPLIYMARIVFIYFKLLKPQPKN